MLTLLKQNLPAVVIPSEIIASITCSNGLLQISTVYNNTETGCCLQFENLTGGDVIFFGYDNTEFQLPIDNTVDRITPGTDCFATGSECLAIHLKDGSINDGIEYLHF